MNRRPIRPLRQRAIIAGALALGASIFWACRSQELTPEAAQVKLDLECLRNGVARYIAAHQGAAPQDLEALLGENAPTSRYLEQGELPLDPWQRPYLYAPPTAHAPFNIRCLGRDGFEGGRAEDADLDLNMLRKGHI